MAKKKKDQELSVSEAQKITAYLYHKKQKEDELLRDAAYVLLKETNPEFDYEVEPTDTADIKGIDHVASAGANAATVAGAAAAATTTAATTATTAGVSTVGAAIAQLQSLGTAGVIAMS